MENNLRLVLCKDVFHLLTVTDVGSDVSLDLQTNIRKNEVVFLAVRLQSHTNYLRTQFMQPDAEPRALEPSMSCHKDLLASIEVIEYIYHYNFIL